MTRLSTSNYLALAATFALQRFNKRGRIALGPQIVIGVPLVPQRSTILLTENEVSRSWSRMFKAGEIESTTFDRAELLLEELVELRQPCCADTNGQIAGA